MKTTLTVVPTDQASEFWDIVRVQTNAEGNVLITWHPDIVRDPERVEAILMGLRLAAEEAMSNLCSTITIYLQRLTVD